MNRDSEFLEPPGVGGGKQSDLNVPNVRVEDPHWKVGDGMNDPQGEPEFIIGQIAVVKKGKQKGRTKFDIVFFDESGKEHGRLHMVSLDA
jgi:hypothetical protein